MKRLLFYLIITKKLVLLFFYPFLERKGNVFDWVRKSIENYVYFQPSKLRAKRIRKNLLKKFTPIRFLSSDGNKLYAWFIKPQGNKPVILHLHGQAESILSHQDIAQYCAANGYGLFMLSFRGHYKTWGHPSEKGLCTDAQSAINQLKKFGVDKDKIIIWGHSMGSVTALETALNNKVKAIVIQSPIKDIKTGIIGVYEFHCRRLNLKFMIKPIIKFIEKINFIQKMDNVEKIQKIDIPLLITHSKLDKVTPYTNAIELAKLNPRSQVALCEEGSHWGEDWCIDKVFEFISSLEYNEKEIITHNKGGRLGTK